MAAHVDPDEIRHFGTLSDQWWNPDGPFRQLQRMTPARMRFIRSALAGEADGGFRPLAGMSILDIGCGGGLLSEPLARLGAQVTGVDASGEAIAAARDHARHSGLRINYVAGSLGRPETRGPFDAVIASEVIEHTPEPEPFLRDIAAVLRPAGTVVLTTLNRTARSLALAKLLGEYVLRFVPAGTHDWRRFVTPGELEGLLYTAGFRVTGQSGIVYRPVQDRFELADDLAVNYALSAVLRS